MEATRFIIPLEDRIDEHSWDFKIPTLPAYAIHSSRVEIDLSGVIYEVTPMITSHIISDDILTVSPSLSGTLFHTVKTLNLMIYHNGIKDYRLLFPHISDISLATRLGQFAEEAEVAFKNAAWLSYSLMVGAVLEGLLFKLYKNQKLYKLIQLAQENDIISEREAELFKHTRYLRNLVHASNHKDEYAQRSKALELSIFYDKLLKIDWLNADDF